MTTTPTLASMSRALAIAFVAAFILAAFVPVASAGHQTLHYTRNPVTNEPVEPGMGKVYEDDGHTARQAGTNLDGLTNRVTEATTDVIGDGSTLLDTIFYTGYNPGYANPNHYAGDVTGRHMLYPGNGGFLSFFGYWNDLDQDGIIDEFSDASPNPEDEFKWRGVASGENSLRMVFFTIPRSTEGQANGAQDTRCGPTTGSWTIPTVIGVTCVPGIGFGPWFNESSARANGEFADRTSTVEYPSQQAWVLGGGNSLSFYDDSVLMESQTITVVKAKPLIGDTSGQIVDVSDPNALIDVDVYEALNQDAETLWVSTMRGIRDGPYEQARTAVNGHLVDGYTIANDTATTIEAAARSHSTVNDTLNLGTAVAIDAIDTAFAVPREGVKVIAPNVAKEPNHALDDYEGRATFGQGDYRGTGNTYPGFEDQWGFWYDVIPEMHVPITANVDARPTGGTYGRFGYVGTGIEPVPGGSPNDGDRNTGVIMNFNSQVFAWSDLNLDHWIGYWCNPQDPDGWDAANDRCANDPHYQFINDINGNPQAASPFEEDLNDAEFISVCSSSTAKGGTIVVMPVGGDWPQGTTVVRQYTSMTSAIWDNDNVFMPEGADPVTLNMDSGSQCGRAADEIIFPRGNPGVSIMSVSTAFLPELKDVGRGIDITAQSVTDVDVYPASL